MRTALLILLLLHAAIHFIGTAKAFDWAKLDAFSQPVSKYAGLAWGLAGILLILSTLLYASSARYWWMLGFVSLVLSQILILRFWSDARWGTIPNVVLLVLIVLAFARFQFDQQSEKLRSALLNNATLEGSELTLTPDSLLPATVQRWLQHSGAADHPTIARTTLRQDLKMRLKPEQERWIPGTARQTFTTEPPAFIWTVDMRMPPGMPVSGRDQFRDGTGAMLIKLGALFPVVDEKGVPQINSASLQRYLGESVWFPTAARSPYIQWEAIDERQAKATLTHEGTSDSGIFTFDEAGDVISFTAQRYKDNTPDAERISWTIEVLETAAPAGLRIPVKAQAHWELPEGRWTWLELTMEEVVYE